MFLKIIFLSRGLMLALALLADCEVVDVGNWNAFSMVLDISILLHLCHLQRILGALDILQWRSWKTILAWLSSTEGTEPISTFREKWIYYKISKNEQSLFLWGFLPDKRTGWSVILMSIHLEIVSTDINLPESFT